MPKRSPALEEKTKIILDYLKVSRRYNQSFIPRPFFVEFTGSPSVGKTTLITELDKYFRREGARVWRPQEGAEVIRHIERTTPLYNIRTGLYALNLLIDLSAGHMYDIVLFDRCIFDAFSWMMYWEEKNKLTPAERNMIQSFFLSDFWTDKIDAAIFMVCDPAEALRREMRLSMSQKVGETTNSKTVEALVNRYKTAYRLLSPKYKQLVMFDTTNLDEETMVQTITNKLVDMLVLKTKSGR